MNCAAASSVRPHEVPDTLVFDDGNGSPRVAIEGAQATGYCNTLRGHEHCLPITLIPMESFYLLAFDEDEGDFCVDSRDFEVLR